jgi:hypothetical protein
MPSSIPDFFVPSVTFVVKICLLRTAAVTRSTGSSRWPRRDCRKTADDSCR